MHGTPGRHKPRFAEVALARDHCVLDVAALFLGPPGTGKSHLVQAIGHSAILQGWSVAYREAHVLMEEIADVTSEGVLLSGT